MSLRISSNNYPQCETQQPEWHLSPLHANQRTYINLNESRDMDTPCFLREIVYKVKQFFLSMIYTLSWKWFTKNSLKLSISLATNPPMVDPPPPPPPLGSGNNNATPPTPAVPPSTIVMQHTVFQPPVADQIIEDQNVGADQEPEQPLQPTQISVDVIHDDCLEGSNNNAPQETAREQDAEVPPPANDTTNSNSNPLPAPNNTPQETPREQGAEVPPPANDTTNSNSNPLPTPNNTPQQTRQNSMFRRPARRIHPPLPIPPHRRERTQSGPPPLVPTGTGSPNPQPSDQQNSSDANLGESLAPPSGGPPPPTGSIPTPVHTSETPSEALTHEEALRAALQGKRIKSNVSSVVFTKDESSPNPRNSHPAGPPAPPAGAPPPVPTGGTVTSVTTHENALAAALEGRYVKRYNKPSYQQYPPIVPLSSDTQKAKDKAKDPIPEEATSEAEALTNIVRFDLLKRLQEEDERVKKENALNASFMNSSIDFNDGDQNTLVAMYLKGELINDTVPSSSSRTTTTTSSLQREEDTPFIEEQGIGVFDEEMGETKEAVHEFEKLSLDDIDKAIAKVRNRRKSMGDSFFIEEKSSDDDDDNDLNKTIGYSDMLDD